MRALAPTTPTYIFPAMNTLMYEHPLTAEHIRLVRDIVRYNVVGPIGKNLACGDVGTYEQCFSPCHMPLMAKVFVCIVL
jgi:phosphopantothenoylcysteine decarboxylase